MAVSPTIRDVFGVSEILCTSRRCYCLMQQLAYVQQGSAYRSVERYSNRALSNPKTKVLPPLYYRSFPLHCYRRDFYALFWEKSDDGYDTFLVLFHHVEKRNIRWNDALYKFCQGKKKALWIFWPARAACKLEGRQTTRAFRFRHFLKGNSAQAKYLPLSDSRDLCPTVLWNRR